VPHGLRIDFPMPPSPDKIWFISSLVFAMLCPVNRQAAGSGDVSQNGMVGGQLDALTTQSLPETGGASPTSMEGPYLLVPLSYLSNYKLHYTFPDPTAPELKLPGRQTIARVNNQIPEPIRNLNGKKVAIKGFMIPIEIHGQTPTLLVITHSATGCCFGVTPRMNGWIYISTTKKTQNKANAEQSYLPVTVYGTLQVGLHVEEDETVSLYRIEAEKILQPDTRS
jgi:hypothetical protein